MRMLWRISNHGNLEGMGGERASGRWHTASRGKRIVYVSEHPALALLEALVNLKGNPKLFPQEYQLMKIMVAEEVAAPVLPLEKLPSGWREDLNLTRSIGDAWLLRAESGLLGVPSVPAPESLNYLLNPLHPEANRLQTEWSKWIQYDQRLFHTHDSG